MSASHPNSWPDKAGPNWALGCGLPQSRWFRWRGTGATAEDALASSLRDAQRVLAVLTGGKATLPDLAPTPTGRTDDGGDAPSWAASFSGGDCEITILAPMLEAARSAMAKPAPARRWWQRRTQPAPAPAPAYAWTRDDAAEAAHALLRICAARLLREGGDTVNLWIGSDSTQPATAELSLYLCPYVELAGRHGHAPLPEPYRAAMAAISTAYATASGSGLLQISERIPGSASARAALRPPREAEDAPILAAFLDKAGLPGDARALRKAEAAGWLARPA